MGTVAAGRLYWWSYVYYVSKYYELLDTVLRVLKAQPLTFLHVFHHALVLLMAYCWLELVQSLQVIGLLANTGIHVVMYSYFLLSSLGVRPGTAFKKLVTSGQIVQFIFRRAMRGRSAAHTSDSLCVVQRGGVSPLPVPPLQTTGRLQRLSSLVWQRSLQSGAAGALLRLPQENIQGCKEARVKAVQVRATRLPRTRQ